MGLLYGLIAVGLALIFGLMDVVNFAHGEFLMIAMYVSFFLFTFFAIDPLLSAPLVAAALFVFGAVVYLLIVRFAMRAKANAGMVQIFSTFGLAIVMRGLAQFFFTPDYRSVPHSWLGGKTVSVAGIFLPVPQLVGALGGDRGHIELFERRHRQRLVLFGPGQSLEAAFDHAEPRARAFGREDELDEGGRPLAGLVLLSAQPAEGEPVGRVDRFDAATVGAVPVPGQDHGAAGAQVDLGFVAEPASDVARVGDDRPDPVGPLAGVATHVGVALTVGAEPALADDGLLGGHQFDRRRALVRVHPDDDPFWCAG
jgi:hypothetical protein